MGRPLRAAAGGYLYHVLNRANGRRNLFPSVGDYHAFEQILTEAVERFETRLLAYCLMPNHWHLVVWPRLDGELSRFTGWLTLTHSQRWHAFRHSAGEGHVYQGRFKSFPVQEDDHFYTVVRYVERNPLRAGLVRRAEEWRWSSLHRWRHGTVAERRLLAPWPLPRTHGWCDHVNMPQTESEAKALQVSLDRGAPMGSPDWRERVMKALGLYATLRPRGRPRKIEKRS